MTTIKVRFTKPASPTKLLEEINAAFPKANARFVSEKYDWKEWGEKFVEVDAGNPDAIAGVIKNHRPEFDAPAAGVVKKEKEDVIPTEVSDAQEPIEDAPITEPDAPKVNTDEDSTSTKDPEVTENKISEGISDLVQILVGPKFAELKKQSQETIKKIIDIGKKLEEKQTAQGKENKEALANQLVEAKKELIANKNELVQIAEDAKSVVAKVSEDVKDIQEKNTITDQARKDEYDQITKDIQAINAQITTINKNIAEVNAKIEKVAKDLADSKTEATSDRGIMGEIQDLLTEFLAIFKMFDDKLAVKSKAISAKIKKVK